MHTDILTIKKNARDEVRIALREYEGHAYVDIRIFTEYQDTGLPGPTRRGVTLPPEKLPELLAALKEVERQALELGLAGFEGR